MSEDSKMGLFGSKDKNQEQSEKSSKDNSPTRYVPYCIDSDTETYDTEALSVMDINDIIGVQSGEQVGDSTLESEIAALSQIITDSKVESSEQLTNSMQEAQEGSSSLLSSTSHVVSIDSDNTASIVDEEFGSVPEKHTTSDILEAQEDKSNSTSENIIHADSSSVVASKNISKSVELDSVKCSEASAVDIQDATDDASVTCTSSSNDKLCDIETDLSSAVLADTVHEIAQSKQQVNVTSSMDFEEDTVEKMENKLVDNTTESQNKVLKSRSEEKPVTTVGNISQSLQLIGEAYISEDSEDTSINGDDDSPKDNSSLSKETLSFNIAAICHDKGSSEIIVDASKQSVEKSFLSNDDIDIPTLVESTVKVEDTIDKETKDLNVKVENPADSSQNETLQQNDSTLSKVAESVNEISSSTHEQIESNTEVDKVDTNEEVSSEHYLPDEIGAETLDESVEMSAVLLKEAIQEVEKNEENKVEENIESESNMPEFTAEEKDNPRDPSESEALDTKEVNENGSNVDNNIEESTEDTSKCENEILPESPNDAQDTTLIKVPDEKCSSELICKSSLSQESDTAAENSVTTPEIIPTEAAETQVDLGTVTEVDDNQDNVDQDVDQSNVEAKETVELDDKVSKVTSSAIKDELEENSVTHEAAEEKESNVTSNVQFVSSPSPNEQSCSINLHSTNLPTQSDASPTLTDIDIPKDTTVCTKEDICAESPVLAESDETAEQLPPVLEKPEVCDDVISNKPEDLPDLPEDVASVLDDTSDTVENAKVSEVEEIEDPAESETKSLVVSKDEISSVEEIPMEEKSAAQQTLDQPELPVEIDSQSTEESIASPKVPSEKDTKSPLIDNLVVAEDNVTSSSPSALQEENEVDKNIPLNEEEAEEEAEIVVPDANEDKVMEVEKEEMEKEEEKQEAVDSTLLVESEAPTSAVETISAPDGNLQDDEEPLGETTMALEKEPEKPDGDMNVESTIEGKSVKKVEEESIEDNSGDVQLDKTSCPILKARLEGMHKKDVDPKTDLKDDKMTPDNVEMSETQSSKDATETLASTSSDTNETTDMKSTIEAEENAEDAEAAANALQVSTDLPNIKKLAEKLSQDSACMDDTIATQNMDSLEGLLELDLMSGSENSSLKGTKAGDKAAEEAVSKVVDMDLLLDQTNQSETSLSQNSDYIANVITSLTSRDDETNEAGRSVNDGTAENEDASTKPMSENADDEKMEEEEEAPRADGTLERNDLDVEFGDDRLESVGDLEEAGSKLELPREMLLKSVVSRENLTDMPTVIENSQSSSEISELESAVKFLQESEEQTIDSPLVLSPKMVESVVEDIAKQADAELYTMPDDADGYTNAESELASRISISISEAEIISEAAKLENERKFATRMQSAPGSSVATEEVERKQRPEPKPPVEPVAVTADSPSVQATKESRENKKDSVARLSSACILKACDLIPRVSLLEERLKEPPKIEIPVPDSTKVLESTVSPNDNLLIPKDSRAMVYPKMLESPKADKTPAAESRSADTPRKEAEKHDFENVGSPRIILKIAKSAIADCGEPRSPKSPKIRSAANSPNPEDSPGQKLGKIKLKLSKGGHPSIISNENLEETTGQWHTDNTSSSLSPIGMKIKLSKSGDASIVGATLEKYESGNLDDPKESSSKETSKYKFEELKRTDSPIGMKIKLSKSGDSASIVQDTKEILCKHKDKLEIPQGSPKRTESPIGMKIKLSRTGDASIIQSDWQESMEEYKEVAPKRTDSPIGMKIKLSKTGDASIVSPSDSAADDNAKDSKAKDKQDYTAELPKRTESPIGMKIKLTKGKGASIISMDNVEDAREKLEVPDPPKRTESPLGMKIKLSKSGDASIIHSEFSDDMKETRHREKAGGEVATQDATKPTESAGIKIKVTKSGETSTSTILPDVAEEQDPSQSSDFSPVSMKIKVSKSGDTSVVTCSNKTEQAEDSKMREVQPEAPKRTESPLGMKIKLSKSGDASIVQSEAVAASTIGEVDQSKATRGLDVEHGKGDLPSSSSFGMKIKLFKTGDASVVTEAEPSRKEKQQRRNKDAADSSLEMKIKLSKTGHPTIVTCDSHETQGSSGYKVGKSESSSAGPPDSALASFSQRYADAHHAAHTKDSPSPLKILKSGSGSGHPSILQGGRSELTIEPIQMQGRKVADNALEISAKRKDITISPIESKKSKLEAQLSQMLPEVTIQPVMCRDPSKQQQQQQQQQQQLMFDPKTSLISRQQMNVISQEISITQVRPSKTSTETSSMSDKLKDILSKNAITGSPVGSDCEIIEHRPELIIVNENSNSSQDVVIIEEVAPSRMADVKVPKKRGRPRRNPLAQQLTQAAAQMLIPRDPLALDEMQQQAPPPPAEHRENERPKRTCRSQKSYAPPKRGRGRGGAGGRGKRKLDNADVPGGGKKPRIDQDLAAIEASTMAVITLDETPEAPEDSLHKSSELYKALKQPPIDIKGMSSAAAKGKKDSKIAEAIAIQLDSTRATSCGVMQDDSPKPSTSRAAMESVASLDSKDLEQQKRLVADIVGEKMQKSTAKQMAENKGKMLDGSKASEAKEIPTPPGPSNWLTPTSKKQGDAVIRSGETVSMVQVIDEETRMSAESGSRSQTPARNIPAPVSETTINEESQGSVLSTATTESEKVKVKNRRMEINFDPDEGPFTVDKIAEYEWPLDRKGETFMIQEQISQYLGVKSFKRKYPDLKRRMVDMEERNYLRENGLVSEAMCDMGLTAVCSSEVLDVMCSDFPDQYEEYRKHMREKQVKEHSKKQKELTAAANAERNRIDLAEMAVQSAMTWNANLNKARKETRKYCLDLQTFTIHVPKKPQKIETEHKTSHYPVALIPGQYTDYYREYTSAELRYYPLNTVLYGPTRPNERKLDSQSEGSQSDSDSESSSDDSSSSSSEGTQDTEGSQSTMDDVDMEIVTQKDDIKLKCKMCLKVLNKHNKSEILIQCGTCNGNVHPSCIDLTLDMVPHIQSYAWQCTDCKTCAQCHDPADEDKMLFCDMCDRGYHIYCVGLRRVPQGRWHCQECAVCANCGSREPGGANSDRNSVAQWQHEYKKGEKNTRVYVSTLCIPCSKLRGDQGNSV